jgi:hypothetical protein
VSDLREILCNLFVLTAAVDGRTAPHNATVYSLGYGDIFVVLSTVGDFLFVLIV